MGEIISESPSASVTAEQKASGASSAPVTSASRRRLRTTLPPGPEGMPFAGNLFQFRANPLNFVTSVARSYGEAATIHMGAQPVILFPRPEHVRYFLTEQPRNFTNREFARNLTRLLGDGLLTTDGDFHRQQRRLVQPAFHKKRVDSYATIMVEHTSEMLDSWAPGEERDIAREMQELTLRIVAQALFDVDLHAGQEDLGQQFTNVIENPVQLPFSLRGLPINLPFTTYGKNMAGRAALDTYVYGLIAQRRAEGIDRGDVVSMLLAAQDTEGDGSGLTDQQVRDQTMTLLAAGHETTSNALTWTMYLLSEHPEIMERLLREIDEVLAGRAPTTADIPKMRYLDWVFNESMRLYPPAWTQGRHAIAPFERAGYTFPAGTMVILSQWVMHRLPEIWGDAETFRPERWDPTRGETVPQGAYFPFGSGPRMCIGMPFAQLEMRLLLATILQRYTPKLILGWPVVPRPRVTLRSKYGMRMTLAASPLLGS
ncbi:MAG TPA: cytochrome P450 [Ktedonobacterales bacterium]|jgi:cytochrome P450